MLERLNIVLIVSVWAKVLWIATVLNLWAPTFALQWRREAGAHAPVHRRSQNFSVRVHFSPLKN